MLFIFVVEASKNDTKSTSSKLLLNFISVLNLVFGLIKIISLVVIKTMIEDGEFFSFWILVCASKLIFDILANTFVLGIKVHIVDHVVIEAFFTFILG
tara:strand:+ start:950 stop:1243 length:294 start_codon:yes stop_codon:yes gene_type:complete